MRAHVGLTPHALGPGVRELRQPLPQGIPVPQRPQRHEGLHRRLRAQGGDREGRQVRSQGDRGGDEERRRSPRSSIRESFSTSSTTTRATSAATSFIVRVAGERHEFIATLPAEGASQAAAAPQEVAIHQAHSATETESYTAWQPDTIPVCCSRRRRDGCSSAASRRWCGCRWTRFAPTAGAGSRPAMFIAGLSRLAGGRARPGVPARSTSSCCSTTSSSSTASTRTWPRPRCGARRCCTRSASRSSTRVLGTWYGKAPGVDRSGDALKHGNYTGIQKNGGVLAIFGDDPELQVVVADAASPSRCCTTGASRRSTRATMQDILDFGLHGYMLSRVSGLLDRAQDRHQRRRRHRQRAKCRRTASSRSFRSSSSTASRSCRT